MWGIPLKPVGTLWCSYSLLWGVATRIFPNYFGISCLYRKNVNVWSYVLLILILSVVVLCRVQTSFDSSQSLVVTCKLCSLPSSHLLFCMQGWNCRGLGLNPPVHVYIRYFLTKNRFKISIPVQNFQHFDICPPPSSFRSIPTLSVCHEFISSTRCFSATDYFTLHLIILVLWWVCLSVCLSVSVWLLAWLENPTAKLHQIFYACCLCRASVLLWRCCDKLCSYFRFCRWCLLWYNRPTTPQESRQ